MRAEQLDYSKLSKKERDIRKEFIKKLIDLKTEELEEQMKELDTRYQEYKKGTGHLGRCFVVCSAIKQFMEEIEDLEEEVDSIEELDAEYIY